MVSENGDLLLTIAGKKSIFINMIQSCKGLKTSTFGSNKDGIKKGQIGATGVRV
jgi:hypothetical protein